MGSFLFRADERHGHAAGTATAPGQLRGSHLQQMDAGLAQNFVGNICFGCDIPLFRQLRTAFRGVFGIAHMPPVIFYFDYRGEILHLWKNGLI